MSQKIRFTGWLQNGDISYETINVFETELYYEFIEDEEKVLKLKKESFLFDSIIELAKNLRIATNILPNSKTKENRLIAINNIIDSDSNQAVP